MFNFFNKNPRINAREITEGILNEMIEQRGSLIVSCMTGWCGACKMQKPLMHDVAHHHKNDKVLVALINIDQEKNVQQTFAISSIPTTLGFKNGELIFRKSGIMTRRELEDLVTFILNDQINEEGSKEK